VLAWLERSARLAVIGALFTIVAIPTVAVVYTAHLWVDVNGLFWWLGWHAEPGDLQVFTLQQLILPASVLIVGGTISLVRKEIIR
jgi:hypothetical protein